MKKILTVVGMLFIVGILLLSVSNTSVLIFEKDAVVKTEELKKDIIDLKKSKENAEKDYNAKTAQLNDLNNKIEVIKKEILSKDMETSRLNDQIKKQHEELTNKRAQVNNLENIYRQLSAEVSQLEKKKEILDFEKINPRAQEEIKKYTGKDKVVVESPYIGKNIQEIR